MTEHALFKRLVVKSAWECDHSAMTEHCVGCGHFWCPCGITWDEAYEGGPYAYDNAEDVEQWIRLGDAYYGDRND